MKKIFLFISLILILFGLFLTTIFLDQIVSFNDTNLEAAIREILDISGKPIYKSQLLDIVELNLHDKNISDLSGIEHFRNLEILNLRNNLVEDVGDLQSLTNLRVLDLGYNQMVNLEKANFASITHISIVSLNLENNYVVDKNNQWVKLSNIEVLGEFSNLQELDLSNNQIDDFSILSELIKLRSLNVSGNQIVDINFLKNMVHLQELNLRDNQIEDLTPIRELINLTYLNLHSNRRINSIKPIENLINIETLILRNVTVDDELSVLSNLGQLRRLNLRNCSLSDISPLVELMENGALQDVPELGIQAYLDILENDFVQDPEKLKAFIPYWDNIHTKYPYLINFATQPAPKFSKPPGFYSEPFLLEIESEIENARIFYTLDGSIPTRDSYEYHQPILIEQELSRIDTFPQASTVRATLFTEGFDEVSSVVTQSYFIGNPEEFPSSLPIVSMSVDPDFLFDRDSGLYVGRNYLERGMKWERPAYVEFFESNGVLGFKNNVNIRIHGVESRRLPQKSFRIYANVDHDETNSIAHEVFPGYKKQLTGEPVNEFKTLLLRNSGNSHFRTMFRDAFVQTLADQTSLETQGYRPAVLFVNGAYWGIYNIRERIDEYYISNHYLVNPDDVAFLEYVVHRGLVGDRETVNEYQKLYDLISENDINNKKIYRKVGEKIDLENFIDYQIIQIYSANMDWPQNNNVFWRLELDQNNPEMPDGLDGRWRWILYDLDFAFHNPSLNLMTFATRDDQSAFLLRSLVMNEDFRHQFLSRFADLMNTSFSPSYLTQKIEEMQSVIELEISRHIERWSLPESLDEWYANIQNKKDFAYTRPEVMREHLIDFFDLDGVYEITLLTDPDKGYVRINSLEINEAIPGVYDVGSWSGKYFNNIPVNITAEANPGYRFVRWECGSGETIVEQHFSITSDEDLVLRAVFEPDQE